MFTSYGVGLWTFVSSVVFYGSAFVLETLRILPSAPLFTARVAPPWSGGLRLAIDLSIQTSMFWAFAIANFAEWSIAEKETALKEARDELARALEVGHAGQLVGMDLAGTYHLTDSLGRGGMGEVYQATRKPDGLVVAVKVLHYHLGTDPRAVARFRREMEAARRVEGARVPTILDSGATADGLHFIVMELLRGEDFAVLLRRRGRVPVEEVLEVADQLAEILDATHAAGIIHRDVKPSNVFLAREASGKKLVYLLDFGIASLQGPDPRAGVTRTAVAIGTPGFLAPEQIDTRYGQVGPATDVFAMAAVVYRALTGHPAFTPANASGAVYAALHQHPAPPSTLVADLVPEIDVVMQVAFAKDPAARYARASEFAADLRRASRGALLEGLRARARAAQATRMETTELLGSSSTDGEEAADSN
jgi:serine/threonine-protein kinase